MPVVIYKPGWAKLEGWEGKEAEVEPYLKYRDGRAAYELKRFVDNPWNSRNYSREEYESKYANLKAAINRNLLWKTAEGLLVPAGVAKDLALKLKETFRDDIVKPEGMPYPWDKKPPELRDYQVSAVESLIKARHASIESAPGTGKTLMALYLVKELGLSAVVCSPFGAIVEQTYRVFKEALGSRRVGMYGCGKHDIKHPVTIATTQSLVQAKGEAAEFFEKKQVLVGDECHTLAADTLSDLCLGLFSNVPYRLFMSGTVLRTDGLQILLDGIVGPVVQSMTAKDAVNKGWLVPIRVRMLRIKTQSDYYNSDASKLTRKHLYESKEVNKTVGDLVNKMVDAGRPVLVMVDELPQFGALLPYLKHTAKFAYGGGSNKESLKKIPKEYHKPDVLELVDEFNAGNLPVLIGTSCLGTGVDIRATGAAFYLRGMKSEIDVRQAAGRIMRLHPSKKDALVFDIDVYNQDMLHRHAQARADIWQQIYPDFAFTEI